jgi:uncharacterized membrane protein
MGVGTAARWGPTNGALERLWSPQRRRGETGHPAAPARDRSGVGGVFLGLAPKIEPRRAHLVASRRAFSVGIVATISVLAAIHVVVISAALTNVTLRVALIPLVPAVIIAVLGNSLGAVRSNFFFGVRTPWTLSSELSWERTNRLAGRLLVPLGLIVALMALAGWALAGLATFIVLLVASMAVAVVYSYRVWRDDPQRSDVGRQAGT